MSCFSNACICYKTFSNCDLLMLSDKPETTVIPHYDITVCLMNLKPPSCISTSRKEGCNVEVVVWCHCRVTLKFCELKISASLCAVARSNHVHNAAVMIKVLGRDSMLILQCVTTKNLNLTTSGTDECIQKSTQFPLVFTNEWSSRQRKWLAWNCGQQSSVYGNPRSAIVLY